MSTQTKQLDLTADHNKVIDKWQANESAERTGLFDQLSATINLMVAFYAVIASTLLKHAGLSAQERTTMTGGTFHGHVTGKKEHALRYAGEREYPSQAYCTRAFLIHYLHTATRLREYRETNTAADLKTYVTWLMVMYGKSTGDHASLTRNADKTLAKFDLTPATRQDKSQGRAYAKAVWKGGTSDNTVSAPKDIRTVVSEVMGMTTTQRRRASALWSLDSYEDSDDLLSMAKACFAEWMVRKDAADKAKAKQKASA